MTSNVSERSNLILMLRNIDHVRNAGRNSKPTRQSTDTAM